MINISLSYDVYFQSGLGSTVHYKEGDNISIIEIQNSNQEYYQNGMITLYNVPVAQTIGDTVLIKINDTDQFAGYVARKQQSIDAGKKVYTYQLIGKTYDLWRYVTDNNAMYTGQTCYIASSLIHTYCPGISGGGVYPDSGVTLTSEMDFTNTIVGDALVSLTKLDGYKFYIDNTSNLQYYKPEQESYNFTVTESDIIDMNPVEEADEDIVNDVLVMGGTDYSSKISQTNAPNVYTISGGIWIAQRFLAEEPRLSAIRLYLDRTIGDYEPDTMKMYIRPASLSIIFDDDYSTSDYLIAGDLERYPGKSNDWLLSTDSSGSESVIGTTPIGIWEDISAPYVGFRLNTSAITKELFIFTLAIRIRCESEPKTIWCTLHSGVTTGNFNKAIASSSYYWNPGTGGYSYAPFYFPMDVSGMVSENSNMFFSFYEETHTDDTFLRCVDVGTTTSDFAVATSNDAITWTPSPTYKSCKIANNYPNVSFQKFQKEGIRQSIDTLFDTYFIKITSQTYNEDYITLSGSNDQGVSWIKLINGVETNFASEGSHAQVMYCINTPEASKGLNPAILYNSILTARPQADTTESLNPSESNVLYGDELTISPSTLPYPSGWSSWNIYTDPKLRLIEGNYYWFVLSGVNNYSTDNKRWRLFYDDDNRSYADGLIRISTDGMSTWTKPSANSNYPSGDLVFEIGWSEGEITATAENQFSIDSYGRHFKIINDSTINTLELAQARADAEVSGMQYIPKKGSITIDGRTDIQTGYRFSANLSNFGIDDIWDVVSYTQRIDRNGFNTIINYNKQPFSITKQITDLQKAIF